MYYSSIMLAMDFIYVTPAALRFRQLFAPLPGEVPCKKKHRPLLREGRKGAEMAYRNWRPHSSNGVDLGKNITEPLHFVVIYATVHVLDM